MLGEDRQEMKDDIEELRAFGLSLPEATTRSPWEGHKDLAVREKTFAFMSSDGAGIFHMSCKLTVSREGALLLPFATPTGYGLGKSGWVTVEIRPGDELPLGMLKAWILESYKARAPKKLVALLENQAARGQTAAHLHK